ncbi:raffinose/stachyose/melibiose transport system substrate-binding protein [Pseudarthrobacter siccitolerans]|uniref:Raffinose/stachyose/melibiose transport system substrate-binding protein n=1 Tax=Pseudarthrobacter siccitolerans TaxID=861266 RepID=A0ABU0PPI8_9MICC|nr:extracellular solute-binding protein [Pseudarthrobacter siccitolerans]MDQ0675141.1 raffinose/stachyose/melibiose transport system substrate-binding protein [Pseudarthrobacter siccitolerans]
MAVLAGSTMTLAGCGLNNGSGGAASSSKALTVWHQFSGEGGTAMDTILKGYNKANPDGQFEGRAIANDEANTVIRTGLSGNNPPTVLQYEGYQQTADYAKAGQLMDITDWYNEHKDNFTYGESQAVMDACGYEGKVYCIPWNVDTSEQIFVNPDIMDQHGLKAPSTIDELKAAAGKLNGAGVSPVSLYAGDGWPAAHWWYLLTIQRCSVDTILKAAKQDGAKWDDPCFEQSAQDLYDLGKAGVFPQGVEGQDYNAMLQLFLSGKAAMMNTGTWFNSTLADTPPEFETEAVAFPQVDPSKPSHQILGGFTNVFGVTANSGNTDAGLKFLDYISDPGSGAGAEFAKSGLVNVIVGADKEMSPRVKASYDAISEALSLPGNNVIAYFENLVPPSVGEDSMYNGAAALTSGAMQPKDFVSKLQQAAQAAAAE